MLNIVCALNCEARPLIDRLKLKQDSLSKLFPVFRSETTQLIISGIGKVNAAAATSYLMVQTPKEKIPAWLNIGIGGHREKKIGEGYIASKIVDRGTGNRYYPGIAMMPRLETLPVETVDRPENQYPDHHIVDMEASGFFHVASRLSPVELIHSYKIISDNAQNSAGNINKQFVTNLVENRTDEVTLILDRLLHLATELNQHSQQSPEYDTFLAKWHFTQSQKVNLENLMRKWRALNNNEPVIDKSMERLKSSRDVLEYLEKKINSQPFTF